MAQVNQGDEVKKSKRTTGVTIGEIVYTNAFALVEYAEGKSGMLIDGLTVEN